MKLFRVNMTAAILLLLGMLLILSGCTSSSDNKLVDGKTNVVTSFYPLYFLAKQIGGEQVNAVNLIPAGVEPHEWSPKSLDLDIASKAQLFLYNGAGFEGWVDNFLKGLSKDSKVVTKVASEGIALIDSEGEEEEHDHGHEADADGHHHDPHTWVSPKSMLIMAENVRNALIEVDADHREQYEVNYEALQVKLKQLDEQYTEKLGAAKLKAIVTSHHAFGYLARDYGLEQVSIMGLSPDAEPKAQDLLQIAKFVKENGIKYIFFEELVSDKLANTLAREAKVETLVLNPVEGLTPEQESKGEDYFSIMEANLQNLLQALQ
ncbi:metal ABC transporter solute-binding protein, Zn/Mn family [Paenibacillus sp. GCM10027626]|uniref:metal ABC transporter solute-binding protein, Zn/Mn family n=1 Tax=Paenibacillus sp. GCM10027626 TaxID=3273411 RepID=UPI003644DD7C